MASRREEKYILDYRVYAMVKKRVSLALRPDPHYEGGSYIVTSLYFDDPYKTAFYEKTDGLSVHTKFRLRSYDLSDNFLRLEKKTKRGMVTEKETAVISKEDLLLLCSAPFSTECLSGKLHDLAVQMQSKGLRPAVTVRYEREAYYLEGTDARVTFDKRVISLPGDAESMFCDAPGVPALAPANVIMEIKYNNKLPSVIRRLCEANSSVLSVSKYALCTRVQGGFSGILAD